MNSGTPVIIQFRTVTIPSAFKTLKIKAQNNPKRIRVFHSGGYEEYQLLGYNAIYVCSSVVDVQRLGKHVSAATTTRSNISIVRGVVFCSVRIVSKESLWVCLCIPL
jgi:hypothetical protein